jgi:hypothetical protein
VDERGLKRGHDVVLAVDEYHDGPRRGVANFRGEPHFFECVFDEGRDEYSECYRLTPLGAEAAEAARENWEIFARWREAFGSGKTDLSTHPALPEETARYRANQHRLEEALASAQTIPVRAKGEFAPVGDSSSSLDVLTPWQVRWSDS